MKQLIDIPVYKDNSDLSLEVFCNRYFQPRTYDVVPANLKFPAVLIERKVENTPTRVRAQNFDVNFLQQTFPVIKQSDGETLHASRSTQQRASTRVSTALHGNAQPACDVNMLQAQFFSANNPAVMYGADVEGSLFHAQTPQRVWNLSCIRSAFQRAAVSSKLLRDTKGIKGLLYFGRRLTGFPAHTENADFFSINFMHKGSVKVWYIVAKDDLVRARNIIRHYAEGTEYEGSVQCDGFFHHKQLLSSPGLLLKHDIQVYRIVQKPGQYVVTQPGVLHWGWNGGDNIAEAANFALVNHFETTETLVIDRVVRYEYLSCRSGWTTCQLKKFRNRCYDGNRAKVPMIDP